MAGRGEIIVPDQAPTARYRVIISELAYTVIRAFKTVFLMQNAVCKFEPSCSAYARESIRTLPIHTAAVKIIWRVLRCNPFSKGGFDPV